MRATPPALERLSLSVPDAAIRIYETALAPLCRSVGWFRDDSTGDWLIEAVKQIEENEPELAAALALAAALTGVNPGLRRQPLAAEDWLAQSYASFPEQRIGRRFAIRGNHVVGRPAPGRITLRLDAGLAFGSGEHGSTRGCLIALERVAYWRPRRILDLGTGSGILAIAAARLLRRPVLAVDIDPWSVRLAGKNGRANGVGRLVRVRRADGWADPAVRSGAPYDLVLANILARPLSLMAKHLASHLTPGGMVILSGLLAMQARDVLAAHRRAGVRLVFRVEDGPWTTLLMRA